MNRQTFKKFFKSTGPVILPVIHVRDNAQALANVAVATGEGAPGVFLINHDFPKEDLLPIVAEVRNRHPDLWMGINFLAVTGEEAFPILGDLARKGIAVDAYWADDACIDESGKDPSQAERIDQARRSSGWDGLYFGGTAFKKQRPVDPSHYQAAAELACQRMDAVTTSGPATGMAADQDKIEVFRQGCDDHPLALASGVTPENIVDYAPHVDAILVATGINHEGDFYNIDPTRLRALMRAARQSALPAAKPQNEVSGEREDRWYLSRMAPNIKGEKFAWLDPSAMYVNATSFHALLDDLVEPFTADEVDVVAGPDAMGFVLGTALATRLGKGFLTIRKSGKIPVEADQVEFVNYTGRNQLLEMRLPAIKPGTRVLLVDQWIETGGTMAGAISLVERQGGVVAGIATVCIEENDQTAKLREQYKISTAVLPGSVVQEQCNRQTLESFKTFDPSAIVPDTKN